MGKIFLAIAVVVAPLGASVQAQFPPPRFPFQTVALTGQPAGDIGGGVTYGGVGAAQLNNRGEVAFWSEGMSGPGVDLTNDIALFAGAPGAVRLAFRAGDPAPGTPDGVRFGVFNGIHLFSDSGHVAFASPLIGPGVTGDNLRGIWVGPPGSVRLLAREGEQAAGIPAGVYYGTGSLHSSLRSLNAQGRVGFIGSVRGPGVDSPNDQGIWGGTPGDVTLVAREGDQPPGLPAGVRYDDLNGSNMGFRATFTGSGINVSNFIGFFAESAGAVQLVARTGQQVPGLPAGSTYTGLSSFRLNDAGHFAVAAGVNGESAVLAGTRDALQVLATGETQAPGAPAGLNFYSIEQGPYLAPDGDVVMVWELRSPTITENHYGLFTSDAGDIDLLARTGDAAPGVDDGATFLRFFPVDHLLSDGTLAFEGRLQGAGVTSANDAGIWLVDPSGEMELVVREGELFDVGGGDLRTISRLSFSAGSGLNDARQIAFQATFTDGSSGVFVTVPEPMSGIAIIAILSGVALRRRRAALIRCCGG